LFFCLSWIGTIWLFFCILYCINLKVARDKPCVINNVDFYNRLRGRIIIHAEDDGKAYYVHPVNRLLYYLGLPDNAFEIVKEQGIGVSNKNFDKLINGK